jgi:hypothetical protein
VLADVATGEAAGERDEFIHAATVAAVFRTVRMLDFPVADLRGAERAARLEVF